MSRRQRNYWVLELLWGRPSRRARCGWRGAHKERRRLTRGIQPLENRVVLAGLPLVATGAADSITANSVKLNGLVDGDGSTTNVLFQYSTSPTFAPTVQTTIASGFTSLQSIAEDASGNLFIADNGDIDKLPPGGMLETIATGFTGLRRIAVDAVGDVFMEILSATSPLGDNTYVVKELLHGGTVRTVFTGLVSNEFLGEGLGLAADAAGDVFVSETDSTTDSFDVKEVLRDGDVKIVGEFFAPSYVAVDRAGDVFVVDGGTLDEVLSDGSVHDFIGSEVFIAVNGLAVDAAGDVFISQNIAGGDVQEVLAGGNTETLATAFSTSGSLAVDALGDVFVADSGANDLIELSPPEIPAVPSSISGSGAMAVSAALTGLDPSTGYYFRAVASNPDGFVVGQTTEFATLTPPALAINSLQATFALGGPPAALAPNATLTKGDGAFSNAALSVVDSDFGNYPSDQLSIASSANVVVNGSSLAYAGETIGSITDRSGTLSISFNASATRSAVLAVARSVTFTTAAAGTRTLQFQFTDGFGALGSSVTETVVIPLPDTAVVTDPAINVSKTSATLTGSVNPEGTNAVVSFQYSTAPSFSPTVAALIGSGFTSAQNVAVDAAGDVFVLDALAPGSGITEILPDGSMRSIDLSSQAAFSMTADAAGDVFASFFGGLIEEIVNRGGTRTVASGTEVQGLAVDAAGDVFVASGDSSDPVEEIFPDGKVKPIGSGLSSPTALAVDAAGDLFVADNLDNQIKEVLPDGTIKTLASGFNNPHGVAVDAFGDVFVADDGNGAVKEILPDGIIQNVGFGFGSPTGVAVDATGNMFVADSRNSQIIKLSPATVAASPSPVDGSSAATVSAALIGLSPGTTYYFRTLASAAGQTLVGNAVSFTTVPGAPGLAISGPPASYALGAGPIAVAPTATLSMSDGEFADSLLSVMDATFVGNRSDRLLIGSSGSLAANGNSLVYGGVAIGNFSGGANGTLLISFNANATEAAALAVVHNVLFTTATFGNRSIQFQLTDGSGNVGATVTQTVLTVLPPNAVVTGPAANVSEAGATLNGTVNPEGSTVTAAFQFSTAASFLPSVQTTVIDFAGYSGPTGVAVDAAGDLFVADTGNNTVEEFFPNGTVKVIGSGFKDPQSLAVDAAGDVYVADRGVFGDSTVREVLPDGSMKTIGSGFVDPAGVAVDKSGDVFVSDNGNAVKEVLPDGSIKTIGSQFLNVQGLAVDNSGDLFVADTFDGIVEEILPNNTIKSISGVPYPIAVAVDASGDVFVVNGVDVEEILPDGTTNSLGSGFNNPTGIAVDAKGDVFVADPGNNAVDEILPDQTVNTIGSGFSNPLGITVDKLGDVFLAEPAERDVKEFLPDGTVNTIGSGLNNLSGVAVDAVGDVFVSESSATYYGVSGIYGAVEEILPDGTVQTIGSGFSNPSGLAVDAAGDVFVADTGNNAVKEVLPDGTIKTIGSGFNAPRDVAVDVADDVFVADTGNKAVKEVLHNGNVQTVGHGFVSPVALSVDGFGDVVVADTTGNDVKEILPDDSVSTIGTAFNDPVGVAADAAGDVFVLETTVVELSPPTIAATPSTVSGSMPTAVSAALSGLTADTDYYFRLVASSAGGSVVGQTVEFITPPGLTVAGPPVSYAIGGVASDIAPAAAVTIGDDGFDKAVLSVVDTNAGDSDQLTIQASDGLAVAGTTISYNGTVVGTFTGGTGTAPFVVTFNSVATPDAVQAVIHNITFAIASANPSNPNTRQLTLQFTNRTGEHSALAADAVALPNAITTPATFVSNVTLSGSYPSYSYYAPVTIDGSSGPVSLSFPSGDIFFNSTIDSSADSPNGSQFTVSAENVQFNGNVGATQPLGDLAVITGGQFSLSAGITTAGNAIITVQPTTPNAPVGLDLKSGAVLNTKGQVKLLSYNGVSLDPGSTLAAGSLAILSDYNGASAQFDDSGATVNLGGTITAASINVQGGSNDTLNIEDLSGQPGSVQGNTITGYGLGGTLTYTGVQPNVAGAAPVAATTAYVQAVFVDLLGRAVDAGGLQYWTQQIASGMPISGVAQAIAHSAEYFERFVVEPAFLNLLGRPADSTGLTYWTNQLQNGVTDQQFEASLVAADEFYNNAGGTDVQWIDAVYQLLLGRAADSGGEGYWSDELAQGVSRSQVAAGIAGSNENNTQLINDDYLHYLGRPADADGLAYWLAQFATGATNEDVIASFTGSTEYYGKVTGILPS